MDRTLSWLAGANNPDASERTLAEIDAAIGLVVGGAAITVRLVNLELAEALAFDGAARAQAAGVRFSVNRDGSGAATLIVGPLVAEDTA